MAGLGNKLSGAMKKGKKDDEKKRKAAGQQQGAGRKNSSSSGSGSSLGSSLKQNLSNEKTGGKRRTNATSYVRATPPAATPTAAPSLSSGIGAAVRGESVGNVPVPRPYSGPSNYIGPYGPADTVQRTLGELAGTIPAVNIENWTAAGSRFGQQGGWTVAGQNLQKSINQGNPSIELWRLYENMPAEINANNYGTWLNEQLQQGGTGGAGGEYSDAAQLRMAAYANQANTLLPAGMQRGAGNVIGQKAPDLASVYQDQASFDADADDITKWIYDPATLSAAEANGGKFPTETAPESVKRMASAWGISEDDVVDWYLNAMKYGGAPQYIVRGEGEERAPYETGFEGGVSTMQDAYSLLARDDFDRMVAIERDTPVAEGAGPRAIQRYNNPDLDAADRVIEQWAGMTEAHAAERGLTREQWIDRAVMAHDQMAGEYDAYLARIAEENGFDASTNLPEMKQWTEAWENLEQVWERTEERRAGLQDKYRGVFADPLYAEGGSREPAVGRKDAYTAIEAVYRMVMSDDAQEVTDLQEASSQYNRRYRTLGPSEDVQYEQFVTTMGARDWRDYHFELLSSTEQGVFDTLYREDPKQALEFLRDMQEELDYRYQYGATEGMRQYATENFGTATVATGLSFLYNVDNNLQGAANLLHVVLNGGAEDMSPYDPSFLSGKLSTAIRGAISERLQPYLKVGMFNAGVLYQSVTSTADSLIGYFTAGPAYAALMGAGAFNNDLAVQLEKNPDAQKALAHALANGVVETVSEYCSLDHLAKATGNIFYDLLTQAAIEGQEELVAAVANRWCDEWLNGGYGEVEQNAFRMILTGETEPFYAWVEANADWWNQALEETLTGFLSGGMSSGGNAASTHIQQSAADVRAGYSIYQSGNLDDVIKLGESSKNAETRELAGKLRQMYGLRGESDSITRDAARMAGRLSDQVQSEQRGQQGTQSTQDVQQDEYTDAEQEAPQDELDLVEAEQRAETEQRALEGWRNAPEQAVKEQEQEQEPERQAKIAPRKGEGTGPVEIQTGERWIIGPRSRTASQGPQQTGIVMNEHPNKVYNLTTGQLEDAPGDTHMSRRTAERRLAADMEALGLSGDESGAQAIRQYQQDAERLKGLNRQAAEQALDLGNANRSGTSKLTLNALVGMRQVKTGVELAQEQAQATQEREEIADQFLNPEERPVRRLSDLTDEQREQYYADLSHEDQALREQYLPPEGIGARGKAAVQAYQQKYTDMLANLNARYGIDTGTRAEQRAEDQAPPAPVQEETAPVQAQDQAVQEQAPDVEEQAERRAEENAPPAPQTEETAEEQAQEEPAAEEEQRDQAQEEPAEEAAEENEQRADQANEEIRDAIEESGEEVTDEVEDALTGEEQTDRQQQRDRAERDQETRKKRKKSEYAAVGRLYRQLAQELDTEAQGVLAENLSRYVSDMLYDNGYQGTRRSRREMANAVLSAALDPSSISPDVAIAIAHDHAAMTALNDLTGKLVQRSELYRQRAALDTLLTSRTQSAIKGEGGKLQTVHIEGIETGEDGELLFRVRRGGSTSTVKADSIEIGRSEAWAAPLAQFASSFGTNADLVFNQYTAGNEGNVNAYINAFREAVHYAQQGRNVESMLKDAGIREVLTEAQAQAAYDIGRAQRVLNSERTAEARRSKGRGVKTGNVDISEIRGLAGTLTQQQRDAIMALKKLAPALGINIKLFASEAVEGRYQRENGSWNDSTRTLSIDIHAGANAIEDGLKNGMMYTFGHELTHYIKQFADAALWDDYQTFVISAIAGKDATYLQGKVKALMEANEGMTEDEAIEDVVADASADCLRLMSEEDARALAELEQLSKYSPNLFERIVDFIKRAAARIRSVIKTAYGSTSRESATYYRAAQLMADQLEEMAKKWNAMLVQAARNANESITQDVLDKVHAQMEAFERGEITAPAIETAEQTAEQTEAEETAEETAAEETAQEETVQEEPAAETDEEMRDGEKVDPDTGLTLSEAIQSAKSLDARDSWAAADLLRNYVTPAAVIDPSTGLVDELSWWRGTPEQRAEFLAERRSRLERAKKRAIADTHIDQRNGTSVKTDAGLFCAQDSYIPMVYALAANQLLGDLSMGNAGARYYNEYEDGRYGFTGEKRHQHPLIEHLLDGEYGARMSYSTIEKGLQEFVQADQEGRLPKDTLTNRRLELVFDTMLSYGYEAFGYPMQCAPDPLYVELKATMEGTKYNGLDAEPPRYAYSWQDLYLRERSGDEAGLDIAMRNPQYETNDVDELAAMAQSGDPSAVARQMYEQLYARPAEAAGADDGAHEAGFTDKELQTLHDVGVGISEDGQSATATDVHQSRRSWNESEYVKAREASIKILSERIGVTEDEARKFIDDINSVAAIITGDRVRYDYTPAEGFINPDGDPISALKGNSEYKDTLDFSTLCAKRIIFTGTMSAIQSRLKNAALDEYDFILIRKMMLDRKYTVPCAFCYVESTRKNNGRVIRQFLDKYAAAQQSGQKFVTGTVDKNGVDHRKYFEPNKSFNGTIESFNTPAGFDATMTEFPDVMAAYLAFMNSKGTAKPKLVEMRTDYRGEILERFKTPVSVRARNAAGGLRLQSFSDFEMVTLIDMMQAVMDMSRVGLMSQAYTKVAAFPMIFGATGIKINLSLVAKGLDADGHIIFDDVEGMRAKDAFTARELYSENVGTILVAGSDEVVRAAMADDRIDFIIPYHRSSWSGVNQVMLGLYNYHDFTKLQSEIDKSTGKKTKHPIYPSEYWNIDLDTGEYVDRTGDENAQAYLELCRRRGLVPKFEEYKDVSGYWKTLIDFKMYDNDGNSAPQQVVKPNFNMEQAMQYMAEFNEERADNDALPAAQDVVDDFVAAYRAAQGRKPGSSQEILTQGLEEQGYDIRELMGKKGRKSTAKKSRAKKGATAASDVHLSARETDDTVNLADIPESTHFSMRSSVERVGDLIAVHNLQPSMLLEQIRNGGITAPSVAIIKAGMMHDTFGPVSAVLYSSAIDPRANRDNWVFAEDAWTPMYPRVEYELSAPAIEKIRETIDEYLQKTGLPEETFNTGISTMDEIHKMFGIDGNSIETSISVDEAADPFRANGTRVRAAFLASIGEHIEPEYVERGPYSLDPLMQRRYDSVIDAFGEESLLSIDMSGHYSPVEFLDMTHDAIDAFVHSTRLPLPARRWMRLVAEAQAYLKVKRGMSKKTPHLKFDAYETRERINRAYYSHKGEFKEWLQTLLKPAYGQEGIRNKKDAFTPKGKRRAFRQTHDDVTPENVVKAMKRNNPRVRSRSYDAIMPFRANRLKSISDMHANESRLGRMDAMEAREAIERADDELYALIGKIASSASLTEATTAQVLEDLSDANKITASAIRSGFLRKGIDIGVDLAKEAAQLIKDIRAIPSRFFESKPMRVLGIDEVAAAVIPSGETELIEAAQSAGIRVLEYEDGNEEQRRDLLNSIDQPGVRFSRRETDEAYMSAVERGDMAEAQRMVDAAAQAAGYDTNYLVWRGDNAAHNVLMQPRDMEDYDGEDYEGGNLGHGLYFTPVRSYAERFARNGVLRKFYLNANVADLSDGTVADEMAQIVDEFVEDTGMEPTNGELFDELLERLEKNGVKARGVGGWSVGAEEIAVQESWQAKLADPVTYRDNGEPIPLSERFNRDEPDIRYSQREDESSTQPAVDERFSDRDPEDITNREILAAALETAAATPEELHRLQNYQKRLGTLRETQQKMEDLQARLTRLRSEGHKDTEEVVRQLITNGKTLQNKIDRIDRTLLNIERMGSIREILNREKAELREKYQQRMKERVAKAKAEQRQKFDAEMTQRDARWQERLNAAEEARKAAAARSDERVQRTNERWGAALEQQRERTREANLERRAALSGMRAAERRADRAETEQYRARLEKYVREMRDWVTAPSGKHPVPDFMRGALGDFLESLDWSSRRYQAGGDMTQNDLRTFEAMERMRRAISQLRSQQSDDLDSAAQEFSGYIDLPPAFTEEFDSIVQSMRRSFELGATLTGTPINRMNAEQLKAMTRILQVLNSALRNMNTLVSNSLYQDATDAANATISDLAELGEMRDRGAMAGRVSDFINWTETTPVYAFKRFGRGGSAIFEGLQNGWDILAHNSADLIEYAKEAYTAQEAREWTRSAQEFTVTDSNGDDHTFQMTAAQIMSLYCLSHRAQAMGHILGGGIKVAEFRQGRKTVSQADNYTLTESDVERITGTLTERQIEVANTLQRYMSTTLSEWGNEVSMQRYGFRMFTEGEYFPIEVDSNNMRAVDEQAHENSLFRLLNMGFTKALVPNANNALVIRDIFEVFSEHGTDMAKYNALALPILDALKWYNYIEKVQGRNGQHTTRSTQKALERAYGSGGKSYIVHLIRDLNGVSEGGRNDSFASRMLSNYKVAAVAANLRVALLQPTSMPRAAYRISPKYLLKAQAGNPVKAARAAREACGIALWKSLGFYDTNISRNVREQVRHEDTAVDRIREASMKLAEWGDAWTLGVIYRAVKAEMRDLQPGLEEGSAEYDDHLNKRMREIIYETQVVDSTMTRSDIMRSKGISQLATSFMSEPTLTLNMLNDGIFEYRMNRRAGRGNRQTLLKIARATGAFTVTSLMAALAESLFQAMRDDDDYEEFWREKFLPALVGEGGLKSFLASNLGMDFNLLNNIPYVKDIMSVLLQGYDNGTPMTEWLTTASKAMTNFGKYTSGESENMTWYSWVYPALQSLSQASGIPVSAAMREFVSAYNTFLAGPMHTAKIQSYTDYDSAIAERLYARIRNGDEAGIAWIRERAAANGVDLDNKRLRNKLKALINEELERGDIDPDEGEELLRTWAGLTASKAEDAADAARYRQETGREWDELSDDYITGQITAEEYKRARMTYAGKSGADAEAEVQRLNYEAATGRKWSDLSVDYNSGVISRSEVKQILMTYGGKSDADAETQIDKYDYAGAHDGSQDGYIKVWRLYDAWHDGGDYKGEAQRLLASGMKKGSIASSIAGKLKKDYLPIRGTAAGDAMLEEILDLYESFGYSRSYERDYIAKNW